jgi:Fe2+ or Zn2+ uptake regulation protein
MKTEFNPKEILHKSGYRATPGRVRLLENLNKASKPLTVAQIHIILGAQGINEVTLYRAIESLVSSGIVRRVDLQQDHAYRYELAGQHHHHHIVCTKCGAVEDFSAVSCSSILKKAAKKSSSFKTINSHSMELFGVCAHCA